MWTFSILVVLMLGLTAATEQQQQQQQQRAARVRRGTRGYQPSARRSCRSQDASRFYVDGESWLQLDGRKVKLCRCIMWKIRCHSIAVTGCARNECYNGGRCLQAVSSPLRVCQCQPGYQGPLCNIDESAQCYRGRGEGYRGTAGVTVSGHRCLNWNLSAVVRSRYNGRSGPSHRWGLGNHNYCRNPDNDTMPWCHVNIGHVVEWERCRLDPCPDQAASDCVPDSGADYRGSVSHSVSGRACLAWDNQELRGRFYNAWMNKAHRLDLGSHRYCRNPSGDTEPWCYIKKGHRPTKEHCGIKSCNPEEAMCGTREPETAQFRIMGGSPVDISSHPWQAAIFTFNRREKMWTFLCGGSLIRSCWVLSAAHCLDNGAVKPGQLRVALGRTVSGRASMAEQLLQVDDFFPHQDFNDDTYDHDIVLLQLRPRAGNTCAHTSRQVRPVCLPRRGQRLADWTECEISGYGREHEFSHMYSEQLKAGNVRLYPESQCTPARLLNRTVTGNMICAGDTSGTNDACKGDSGGPLVCMQGGRMRLQGVISWGVGCGKKDVPGVYTKVQNYLDWMQKLMTAPDSSKYKSHQWKG